VGARQLGHIVLRDPQGVEVTLTEERWGHILERRLEMIPYRTDLERTITAPEVIYLKGTDRIYFRRVRSPQYGHMYLRATVVLNRNYFVVTAWLMNTADPKGAVQIWTNLPR